MIENDEKWFNEHLRIELNKLLSGKTSLSSFKCFLYPNSHWLEIPSDHISHDIKLILAEQYTFDAGGREINISDDEMVNILRKEISKLDLDL